MVAFRNSYRPARSIPPVMFGFALRALMCTSAISKTGGVSTDRTNPAIDKKAARLIPVDVRKFKCRLRRLGLSECRDEQKGCEANGCEYSRHLFQPPLGTHRCRLVDALSGKESVISN